MDGDYISRIAKLGYTPLWVEYGILDPDSWQAQEFEYLNSDNTNSEHYRYQTLIKYISARVRLTDQEFANYLQIVYSDPDTTMAGSAAVCLFTRIQLTDIQFNKLCTEFIKFGDWTEKVIRRQIILRELGKGSLTEELFNECVECNDSIIHEYILDMADKYQLQQLALRGANRKVKVMATVKLRSLDLDT